MGHSLVCHSHLDLEQESQQIISGVVVDKDQQYLMALLKRERATERITSPSWSRHQKMIRCHYAPKPRLHAIRMSVSVYNRRIRWTGATLLIHRTLSTVCRASDQNASGDQMHRFLRSRMIQKGKKLSIGRVTMEKMYGYWT